MNKIFQFHENPAILDWWVSYFKRALTWQTPLRRRKVLTVGAIGTGIVIPYAILDSQEQTVFHPTLLSFIFVVFSLFLILRCIFEFALRLSKMPVFIRKHPQITLHFFFWALLAILWNAADMSGLWRTTLTGVAIVFPFVLWRCGYMLLSGQYNSLRGTTFSNHLFYLWPVFGGNETPYGKGFDYLSKCEAKNEIELARSQLSGIHLLLLGLIWGICLYLMQGLLYGSGNGLTKAIGINTSIPALGQLVKQGSNAPWLISWLSIYCELFKQVLKHASGGHAIVGILRLLGFNVFRSTYKPLLAESVTDFWNRYYYYFKELLSTFFFMPAFMGIGRKLQRWPNLRLLVAVYSAAFFGNIYYHTLSDEIAELVQGNLTASIYAHVPRIFYCFLLGIGIYVSMLREQKRRGSAQSSQGIRRYLRIFGVWTFFALIFIWDVSGRASFSARLDFFFGLFGFI